MSNEAENLLELFEWIESNIIKVGDEPLNDDEKKKISELAYPLYSKKKVSDQPIPQSVDAEEIWNELISVDQENDNENDGEHYIVSKKHFNKVFQSLLSHQYSEATVLELLGQVVKDIENGDSLSNPEIYLEQYNKQRSRT